MTDGNDEMNLPEMDPEIRTLLQRERTETVLSGDRKERAARRLEHAILLAPITSLGGGVGSGTGHGASQSPSAPGATAGAAALAGAKTTALWSVATKIGIAAVLLGAGAAVGAGVSSHRERPEITSVATQTTTAATEPIASAIAMPFSSVAPVDSALAPQSATDKPPAAVVAHDPASPGSSAKNGDSTSLGEEQQLIDMARAAVARGAYKAAENSIDEHQRRFPNGTLAEEREFLAVQALAGAGDMTKSRERAARFERRYPNSIFLPAVEKTSGIQSE